MKRLSLVVTIFTLVAALIALAFVRPANAGAATTATPGPTLTPGAPANPASIVKASQLYFHSSGIMSIPQPDNWPLAEQGAEELVLPNVGSKLTRAGVTFINNDALSVIHAFVENAPGRPLTGTIGMDKRFDKEYWNEAWANFTGGWQEIARRDDGRRFVVDFDLSLDGAIYRGRQ